MFVTAIILGFAGSLHCAGMCSPLAFAVFSRSGTAFLHRVLYNVGRILMYCVLGAGVSMAGVMLPVTIQFVISIALGVTLLVIGIAGYNFKAPVLAPLITFTTFLKVQFSKFLQNKKQSSIFAMGVLNGLLPCGLTFLALTSCITLQSPLEGIAFMAIFGSGTLPVMLGLVSIVPLFEKRLNFSISGLTKAMQIVAGCLLIIRVLFFDPQIHITPQRDQIVICQ